MRPRYLVLYYLITVTDHSLTWSVELLDISGRSEMLSAHHSVARRGPASSSSCGSVPWLGLRHLAALKIDDIVDLN